MFCQVKRKRNLEVTDLPFLIVGLICIATFLILLSPGIARMFLVARRNVQDEPIEAELIEETAIEG